MEDNSVLFDKIQANNSATKGPAAVPGGNFPYVVVPDGYKVESLEKWIFNEHMPRPERIRQSVKVFDGPSFVEYHKSFSDDNSRVFADESSSSLAAILDYHGAGPDEQRWGSHKLTLALRRSERFNTWTEKNGKEMKQADFSEFLDQHSTDVTSPSPAEIRDIASDLQMTTEVEFGSFQRQSDGQVQFRYVETVRASAKGGELTIPNKLTLSLPVYVGGPSLNIEALFRFRVRETKLTFWYTLIRPEEVLRAAFLAIRQDIADAIQKPIINGSVG